jgi:hypothetical protein
LDRHGCAYPVDRFLMTKEKKQKTLAAFLAPGSGNALKARWWSRKDMLCATDAAARGHGCPVLLYKRSFTIKSSGTAFGCNLPYADRRDAIQSGQSAKSKPTFIAPL